LEKRRIVQLTSTLLNNAYLKGFATLSIYQGKGKAVCVPVLNCYSCPGALGSCPVGSAQFMLASYKHQLSLYVFGILTMMGAASGRLACGWLCPFGLFQELLNTIPFRTRHLPSLLKWLKYPVLILTLLLPVIWINSAGIGEPYFCKYLCPAGTLEAGLPLGLGNSQLRSLLGALYYWKLTLLLLLIAASISYYRPFCRIICPLGAFYALFNRISLWRFEIDHARCTSCGICSNRCPMEIQVPGNPNDPECIRCMRCSTSCPSEAITFTRIPRLTPAFNEENLLKPWDSKI